MLPIILLVHMTSCIVINLLNVLSLLDYAYAATRL